MTTPHKLPSYWESSFNCPHCGAYAAMRWGDKTYTQNSNASGTSSLENLSAARCGHCERYSLWLESESRMIFPFSGIAPLPNSDLPPDITADYMEARDIFGLSARGAAALLRLCIQKLCAELGESGKDINKDIASLVKKGLNPSIQQSLDIVRVIGNESVHPGKIDLRDEPETAQMLFALVNIIADSLITQPKLIAQTYNMIPEGKRKAIENRDKSEHN